VIAAILHARSDAPTVVSFLGQPKPRRTPGRAHRHQQPNGYTLEDIFQVVVVAFAQQARSLGFDEVIDLPVEKFSDGVRRITEGYGADIVIDAIGGQILSEALGTLALGGSLTTMGYSAGRKTTIDVTDLIWKRASMKSFSLFAQPAEVWSAAWSAIFPLLQSGAVKPIVAKTFPLAEAADALRYLIEGRPFGRVVLTI
jgi:NADPH2:quinone reductase